MMLTFDKIGRVLLACLLPDDKLEPLMKDMQRGDVTVTENDAAAIFLLCEKTLIKKMGKAEVLFETKGSTITATPLGARVAEILAQQIQGSH